MAIKSSAENGKTAEDLLNGSKKSDQIEEPSKSEKKYQNTEIKTQYGDEFSPQVVMALLRNAGFDSQMVAITTQDRGSEVTVRGFLEEEEDSGNNGGMVTYLSTVPTDREAAENIEDLAKLGAQKLRVFARSGETEQYLQFYLGHEVVVKGKLTFHPLQEPPSALQVSLEADSLMECPPVEVAACFKTNAIKDEKGEALKNSLSSKILQQNSINVCVIGPDNKGVGDFREEMRTKTTKPDSPLAKYVRCQIQDSSLTPDSNATKEEIDDFYESLGTTVVDLAKSPAKFDLMCLMREGGKPEDLARLNNTEICKAVTQSPVPVVMAIGQQGDKFLWLKRCVGHSIPFPGTFAGFLEEIANRADVLLKNRLKSNLENLANTSSNRSSKDTLKTLLTLYGVAGAILLIAYLAIHYSGVF